MPSGTPDVIARDDLHDIGRPGFDRCLVEPVPWGARLDGIRALTTRHAASA